jgi:ferric-dicitrate binding protein FerR (iron transport regulator)
MNFFKRVTAIVVCFMISPLAGLCDPQGGTQRAGQIDALIPAATRNAQTAKAKDEVDWNDLLKTAHNGRVRAGLTDGSILSVGSDSELRVVQHDSASQQTSLELDYGKVRNQVTNITKSGGKYELKTPNAVIGVIGTDFVTLYRNNKTTVWCLKGRVRVTPMGKVARNSGTQSSTDNTVTLTEGQMVVISSVIPSAGFQASNTPPAEAQNLLLSTDVPDNNLPPPGDTRYATPTHAARTLLLGGAISVGLALGLGLGTRGGHTGETVTQGCKPSPAVVCPSP